MNATEWKGLLTELGAGRSLKGCGEGPTDDEDVKMARTWNAATDRAMRIVEHYRDGEGLFSDKGKESGK